MRALALARLAAAAATVASAALAWPAAPAFAGEDEAVLALEPGYGLLSGGDTIHGAGGGAAIWYGITEALWLSGSAGAFEFFHEGDDRLLFEAHAGLVAALDVLRTIPFFEAELGFVARAGGKLAPGLRFGLGADYLVSPTFSLGAVLRYRTLSDDELGGDGLLSAQVRIGFRFEL